MNFEYLSNSEASLSLFILSSYILLNFIASFYGNVLNGMQLMFYRNFIEVCFGITLQAGILILIFNSFDVKYITIFFVVNTLIKIVVFICVISYFLKIKYLIPSFSFISYSQHKKFIKHMLGVSFITICLKQYDKLLISIFLSIGSFGTYTVVNNILEKVSIISYSISLAVYPKFSELVELNKINQIRILYNNIYQLNGIITFPLYVMFFAFSNYLFEFIFDNQISESLKLPILILCVAFYLNNIQNIIYRISLAVNETKIVLKKDIISAIIVIPLSFILIKEYGVVGGSISHYLFFDRKFIFSSNYFN